MASQVYKCATYTYVGPCLDQRLYNSKFQLQSGDYREPDYQWIIDPEFLQTPGSQRLSQRTGFAQRTVKLTTSKDPFATYRPYA